MLAGSYNSCIAGVAGIASRSDRALERHPTTVAGAHKTRSEVEALVVEFVVGMDQRVAVEGRCLLVAHYTIQTSTLVVAAGEEVVGNKRYTQAARNRAGSNRMVGVHW